MVAVALGLARRKIGGPDLQKPDRKCAYMQSAQIGSCWMMLHESWMKPGRGLRRLTIEVTEKKSGITELSTHAIELNTTTIETLREGTFRIC